MSSGALANPHLLWWTAGAACGAVAALVHIRRRELLGPRIILVLLVTGALTQMGAKWQYRLQTLPLGDALAAFPREFYTPGMRMPLGIVLGGAGALAASTLLRLPWRDVGDALGVAASLMMIIGRLGCFAAGCCMGSVCPSWLGTVCPAFPPGSEVHNQHLRANLIQLGDVHSLPVHPLPAYFALASLLTLAVMVLVIRRRGAPGMAMLWFVALGSGSKLALEFLRGSSEGGPAGLMFWLPVGGCLAVLAVLLGSWLGRLRTASAQRAENGEPQQ